jgi:YD repeat-containing protein
MVIKYNKEADSIYIEIAKAKIAESDQEKKDIILDYDEAGNIVGIEILNASKKTKQPNGISYEVA